MSHSLDYGEPGDSDYISDDEEDILFWYEHAIEWEKADYRLYAARRNSDIDDYQYADLCNEYLSREFNDIPGAMHEMAEKIENGNY